MSKLKRLQLITCVATLAVVNSLPFWQRSAAAVTPSVPVTTSNQKGYSLNSPDWSKITFDKLPPAQTSGWIKIPSNLAPQVGYSELTWKAGDSPSKFVTLGTVSEAFSLESFSLANISDASKASLKGLSLKDVCLTKWQTPKSLVAANPAIGNMTISSVPPLQELAAKYGSSDYGYYGYEPTVNEVIDHSPAFADASLGELDLSTYSLTSIPELETTSLSQFSNWQACFINQIPGLAQVPFDKFPIPAPTAIDAIGIADVVWSKAEIGTSEVDSSYFISGSDRVGFNKRCDKNKPCSYLELSDLFESVGSLHGHRWVSGESQKVKGGYGLLGAVNNGKEPTGRLVFGSGFKVVMTGANESKGTADFGLYFRFCHHGWIDLGCTPYFIGPIPWIPVKEKDLVIVKTH